MSDVLRLLDDATRAGGDGAAGVLKQMESSLSGMLRCVFAYTVLPWPRLSADAWVSVCVPVVLCVAAPSSPGDSLAAGSLSGHHGDIPHRCCPFNKCHAAVRR